MKAIYPQYLNSPFKAAGFESDDLIIAFMSFGIGMLISVLFAFVAGILVTWVYRKAKDGKPRGFLQHLPYALGIKAFKGFDDVFYAEYGE